MRKFLAAVLLAASVVMAGGALAEDTVIYIKYERVAGTPNAPYITYNVYQCYRYHSGQEVCEFRYTTIGINPDL